MLAIVALILAAPLFFVIATALLLSRQWPVIIRERIDIGRGQTLVRLSFNTRAWGLTPAGNHRTTKGEKLAYFLHRTKIEELPSLLLIVYGLYEADLSSPAPGSFVTWECLCLWAGERATPQLRYEDVLMDKFHRACDNLDLELATELGRRIEALYMIPVQVEDVDSRTLISQFAMGQKRLTLVSLRLWQLRHPDEPPSDRFDLV
jgi:hypothetical protein